MLILIFKIKHCYSADTFQVTASVFILIKSNTHSSHNYKNTADTVLSANALAVGRWGQQFRIVMENSRGF